MPLSPSLARLGIAAILLAAACGKKKPDCGALSVHVAEVSTRNEDPRFKEELYNKARAINDQLCSDGSYTAEQIDCLQKANAKADVNRCLGLPELDTPRPVEAKPVEPSPPPPPPPKAKPTIEQAAPALVRFLGDVSEQLDEAFMHGCREGFDRMSDAFEKKASSPSHSELFEAIKADPTLSAALASAVRDKTRPELAAALAKLEAKATGCKDASVEIQKATLSLLK